MHSPSPPCPPDLSLPDRRLLALLLHLQRWPFDASSGEDLQLTWRTLATQARRIFPGLPEDAWPEDWLGMLGSLADRGLLVCRHAPQDTYTQGTYALTPAGRTLARPFHRGLMAKGFGDLLVDALDSQAYSTFCQRALGLDIGHFSPVDARQLALLESVMLGVHQRHKSSTTPFRWLDVGCGAGSLAARWTRRLDDLGGDGGPAIAYGIDLSEAALVAGRRRFRELGPRLKLHVADAHDLRSLPAASFDVLLAVDVLAFLDDPVMALRGWLRLLLPAGYLLILGSSKNSVPKSVSKEDLEAEVPWQDALEGFAEIVASVDLTPLERQVWRAQRRVLPHLEPEFRAEGRLPLYRLLFQEAQRCGRWADLGATRRTLTILRSV